jgi:hypothetical protein
MLKCEQRMAKLASEQSIYGTFFLEMNVKNFSSSITFASAASKNELLETCENID